MKTTPTIILLAVNAMLGKDLLTGEGEDRKTVTTRTKMMMTRTKSKNLIRIITTNPGSPCKTQSFSCSGSCANLREGRLRFRSRPIVQLQQLLSPRSAHYFKPARFLLKTKVLLSMLQDGTDLIKKVRLCLLRP